MNVQSCWYTAKYEFELEAIVFAAWGDVAVKNIPIHVYYPRKQNGYPISGRSGILPVSVC